MGYQFIIPKEEWIDRRLIEPVNGTLLSCPEGVVFAFCGDGRHAPESVGTVQSWIGAGLVHLVTLNGGCMCMSPLSPLWSIMAKGNSDPERELTVVGKFLQSQVHVPMKQGRSAVYNIVQGAKLMGVNTVVLRAHDSCGAAGLHGLSALDYLRHYVLAKLVIKEMAMVEYGLELHVLVCIQLGEVIDGKVVRTNYRLDMKMVRAYLLEHGIDPEAELEAKMLSDFNIVPESPIHAHGHNGHGYGNNGHDHGSNGHGHHDHVQHHPEGVVLAPTTS